MQVVRMVEARKARIISGRVLDLMLQVGATEGQEVTCPMSSLKRRKSCHL